MTVFVKILGRSKLLFVLGFVSYGLLSALFAMLEFSPTLHGGSDTFIIFAVATFVLMGGRMEPVTEFIQYTGIIIGFVGTGVVWTLFAIFVHSILAWLDEDKHVFERFKRK